MQPIIPFLRLGIWLAVLVLAGAVAINLYIERAMEPRIFEDVVTMPTSHMALILGASVRPDGTMNVPLADRAETALMLYQTGAVEKILVSGDHNTQEYNEVAPVFTYLTNQGVPAEDIYLDHVGLDTYDSIFRAREVYAAESLVIVSQRFHLPRALYIARSLGIPSVGFSADRHVYLERNNHREWVARIKAFLDVQFGALPAYLDKREN